MLECLTNIIGITKEDTQCLTGGLSSETLEKLKLSNSDRYLDDLPGGVHLKALRWIDGANNMATLAFKARDQAIMNLEADLTLGLAEKYEQGKASYIGTIGRASYSGSLPGGKRWQGIRIVPVEESDAGVTLTRIQASFTQGGTIPIYIIQAPKNSVQGTVIYTANLQATPNAFSEFRLPVPLYMPFMINNYMDEVEYWVVYDTLATGVPFMPKDTKIICSGCDGRAANILADYASIYGVTIDSPDNLSDRTVDIYSHGLILDVDIRCTTGQLFCREYDNRNAIALAMAWAVWYKAGELLAQEVRKSPDVNRYTQMSDEQLRNRAALFQREYSMRVQYLVNGIDVKSSNCYVCKAVANQPVTGGIMA
jgi:hypothetical protein